MYSNITASIIHIFLATTLAINYEMGMLGVAIASSVQFVVRFLVTVSYIRFSGLFDEPENQVPLLHSDSFRNWGSQFLQSLQCMSLSVWSWWAMDVFTLIASFIPTELPTE